MSKQSTVAEVLHQTNVDVKISKSDLVDMVVAEREAEIQEQVDSLRARSEELRVALTETDEAHKLAVIKLFKKEHSKKVKAAEKFLGVEATYDVDRPYSGKEFLYPEQYQPYNQYNNHPLIKFNAPFAAVRPNHEYKRRVSKWSVWRSITCNVETQGDAEAGRWMFCYDVPDDQLEAMPTFKKLEKLANERNEVDQEYNTLQQEKNNLHNMGQRAKAKLVRSILESTEQGQRMLANISGVVRASNKALKGKTS